ncbi:polysaccharide biosynthesis/export family protein [Microvirga sp. 2YAF29]|uniref:polysaccharide biosynthesis/export family protein n=1 Tax=Microvirga sp. 2YAF29 TaxID=3233031 RepID=UPI003F94DFA9
MSKQRRPSRYRICSFLALALFASPTLAAEYKLAPGDAVEFAITGTTEERQPVAIDVDGQASFPLIGPIPASGLSIAELREHLQQRLSQQVYQTATGSMRVIEARDINLRLLSYRPIYVTGDVARTGEVPFKPGLTVRQAVVVSGGYDLLRTEEDKSQLRAIDIESQHSASLIDLSKETARVWRLKASLGQKEPLDHASLPPLDSKILSNITRLQEDILSVQQTDYENQKGILVAAIKAAEVRVSTLSEQVKNESEGAKLDEEELKRVKELSAKSIVPVTRVTEVRRAALLASSRALQTGVAAEYAKKELDEFKSRLQRHEDTYRMANIKELEEANSRLETLRVQTASLRERVLLTSTAKTDALLAAKAGMIIVIYRKMETGVAQLDAAEDTELQPGDTVEVHLRVGLGANAVSHAPIVPGAAIASTDR